MRYHIKMKNEKSVKMSSTIIETDYIINLLAPFPDIRNDPFIMQKNE